MIGRFPGETSALSLIWAVIELASRGWYGVRITPRIVAETDHIRRGSAEPLTDEETEEVIAASDHPIEELRPGEITRMVVRDLARRGRFAPRAGWRERLDADVQYSLHDRIANPRAHAEGSAFRAWSSGA